MRTAFIFFLLITTLQAQSWSHTTRVDSIVTISLPAAPEMNDTAGVIQVLLNMDSVVVSLTRLPSPAPVPNPRALTEHYDGLCQGFLGEVNGQPIDMHDTVIAGIKMRHLYFSYTYPKPPQPFGAKLKPGTDTTMQTDYRRCWFWLVNKQVYALQYWYMGPEKPEQAAFAETLIKNVQFTSGLSADNQLYSPPAVGPSSSDLSWMFFVGAFIFLMIGYLLWKRWQRR